MTTTGKAGEGAAADGGAKKPGAKKKRKLWTAALKGRFLDKLATTCNVAASARAVKMSDSAVYGLRARSPAFAEAWAAALRIGYERLELSLLERALEQQKQELDTAEAKAIEAKNRLGLQLLAAHRAAVAAMPESRPASVRAGSVREWLEAKLSEMNKRMGGDG